MLMPKKTRYRKMQRGRRRGDGHDHRLRVLAGDGNRHRKRYGEDGKDRGSRRYPHKPHFG